MDDGCNDKEDHEKCVDCHGGFESIIRKDGILVARITVVRHDSFDIVLNNEDIPEMIDSSLNLGKFMKKRPSDGL